MGAATHHMDVMPVLHRQTDTQCCVALTGMLSAGISQCKVKVDIVWER